MAVVIVTDSTAYLPAEVLAGAGIRVVPLSVTVAGFTGREGAEVSPADVARALGERRANVTTSRPAPADFSAAYAEAFDAGATGIVSVHISARLSGTFEAATMAAADFDGRVRVVDSATAGVGVGFVAKAAAAADGSLDEVEATAIAAAQRITTLFYVDTLEFLRRGGRITAAQALLGTALAVKPILHTAEGEVRLREKVRTANRALARLAELAVEAAEKSTVDIAVQHLGAPDRAGELIEELERHLGPRIREAYLTEVGAVVAAHTGPGVVGVAVHRLP